MRAILTWHSLDGSGSPISIAPDEFRRQITWLLDENVRIVTVEELLRLDDRTDAAALTFDDGFANTLSDAVPILREHDLPAACFVVPAHVGGDNRWGGRATPGIPTLPLLDWDGLARLRDAGVAVGGHTRTHPRLSSLTSADLEREIGHCAVEIQDRLGVSPAGFAYPFGDVNSTVAAVVRRAYAWAVTTELRPLGPDVDESLLPRLDMWYATENLRRTGWGSAAFRTWISARRQARRLKASISPSRTQ